MEHKKFDKEILQEIKTLYVYDDWHGIVAIIYDYLMIIFAILLSEFSYWFLPLTVLLIGSRQRALATVLHEASHSALTKNQKLGKILGTYFSGYLIFQSWDSYSLSHVKNHHPKLGSEFDPDFAYYKQSGIFEINSKSKFFWKFFFSRLFCLNIFQSLKYLIFNRLMVCSNKNELIKIMLVHL